MFAFEIINLQAVDFQQRIDEDVVETDVFISNVQAGLIKVILPGENGFFDFPDGGVASQRHVNESDDNREGKQKRENTEFVAFKKTPESAQRSGGFGKKVFQRRNHCLFSFRLAEHFGGIRVVAYGFPVEFATFVLNAFLQFGHEFLFFQPRLNRLHKF